MKPKDPYRAFRFKIELNGITRGGFQTVSGLERQTEVEPYREGGVNDHERQLVVKTTHPPLTLKRGLVDAGLWTWHKEVVDGAVDRRTLTVVLYSGNDVQACAWTCTGAYPTKWTASEFDAMADAVLTESVEIVYHELSLDGAMTTAP